MYPVLTLSEFRPDMYQAFMGNGHYTTTTYCMNNIQLHVFMCEISQKYSYDKIDTSTIFWHRAKV